MKRVTLGAIVVGLLSLTGGCGGTAPPATPTPVPTPANVSVTGTFLLRGDITVAGVKNRSFRDWETVKLNDECHGSAGTGYQDIVSATEVLLLGDGQIVAKTNLGTGVFRTTSGAWPAEKSDKFNTALREGGCMFSFGLDVPPGSKFYTLKVGRRGETNYTLDELKVPGAIALILR